MKFWSPLVLLVLFAHSVSAQWLSVTPATCDRGRPVKSRHLRAMSMPMELPNWPFPNVNVTRSSERDQTEPTIAIDPTNPNNLIAGANDDRAPSTLWAYVSNDAGMTWKNIELPPGPDWATIATDPSIAFNSNGFAYYLFGHANNPPFHIENSVSLFR